MLWRRSLALGLVASLVSGNALAAGPTTAPATRFPSDQDVPRILAELRDLSSELEYDRVVARGRRLLLRGDLSDDQRVEGLLLFGSALVFVGDPASRDVFDELLRLRPSYTLPAGSERKVVVAFADAQQRLRDALAAGRNAYVRDMVIETPDLHAVPAGNPLVFEFVVRDPAHYVHRAAVRYRLANQGDYLALTLEQPKGDTSTWIGSVPGAWTASRGGGDVQWYFTTTDSTGEPLVGVADAGKPRLLHIDRAALAEAKPIYATWWFWTIIGAAAVTTGAVLVAAHGGAKNPPASDLGTVVLR